MNTITAAYTEIRTDPRVLLRQNGAEILGAFGRDLGSKRAYWAAG